MGGKHADLEGGVGLPDGPRALPLPTILGLPNLWGSGFLWSPGINKTSSTCHSRSVLEGWCGRGRG